MNRCKLPQIPSLLIDNKCIIDCGEKATKFNDYFTQHCKHNVNNSAVLHLEMLQWNTRLRAIDITMNDIKLILYSWNHTKACGPDNITIRMLLLCIVPPFLYIFHNMLYSGVYPDAWKEANVSWKGKQTNCK